MPATCFLHGRQQRRLLCLGIVHSVRGLQDQDQQSSRWTPAFLLMSFFLSVMRPCYGERLVSLLKCSWTAMLQLHTADHQYLSGSQTRRQTQAVCQ